MKKGRPALEHPRHQKISVSFSEMESEVLKKMFPEYGEVSREIYNLVKKTWLKDVEANYSTKEWNDLSTSQRIKILSNEVNVKLRRLVLRPCRLNKNMYNVTTLTDVEFRDYKEFEDAFEITKEQLKEYLDKKQIYYEQNAIIFLTYLK